MNPDESAPRELWVPSTYQLDLASYGEEVCLPTWEVSKSKEHSSDPGEDGGPWQTARAGTCTKARM